MKRLTRLFRLERRLVTGCLVIICLISASLQPLPAAEPATIYDNGIYFEFSTRQLEKFEQIRKDRSRQDFKLKIRTRTNSKDHRISAHLRGQGTLRYCDRNSYTIDMPGREPWDLIPGSNANQFYLISMCQDEDYLRTATVLRIWKSLGFFPLEFRYVELLINSQTQGLYLLMEKPADALPRKLPTLRSLIRRRFDPPDTYPEVKYSSTDETIAEGDYVNTFTNLDNLDQEEFVNNLESRLDVPQFILHLAVAAVLYNGDYVDELWFLQLPVTGNTANSYRYQVMKWDPDDTFRACHYGVKYAWMDPWGIAKCAETELAKVVLSHPIYYRQFVGQVQHLLQNALTPGHFDTELARTVSLLEASLTSDQTAKVMEQFQDAPILGNDRQGALQQIRQSRHALSNLYRTHHKNLTTLVNAYLDR